MQACAAAGNSARRRNYYPEEGLHTLVRRPSHHCIHPCTAPGHSIPTANHDTGWQWLCCRSEGVLHLSQECHTLHPPEHHTAGPQSLLIPGGVIGPCFPRGSPAAPHIHYNPKPQDHRWPSGSCHPIWLLLRKTTKPKHPSQGKMGLTRGNNTAPAATPSPQGQDVVCEEEDHSPSCHSRAV